jgi:UDP-N-acetyl-D-galactosamine dehydrogenase
MELKNKQIGLIGLGYVGLPLAVEFGKYRKVVGYDIDDSRIRQLRLGIDHTKECSACELTDSKYLQFSSNILDLSDCEIFIITVPTPVDRANRPDMSPLIKASKAVGKVLKIGDIVIYESTVYPGATEEICVPVLEQASGLIYNVNFYCGYSPERINPGDKDHRLSNIKKITSGSTPVVADVVDLLYSEIITAGTHRASSIKVAEAAKVIENTQRDVNIALINEFSLIFNLMEIDTLEVLEAAGTKWNFLPFRPGLVGGHCIGVDPYYLTHKAEEVGYHPEMILAARRINDHMSTHVADEVVKLMLRKNINLLNCKILILGLSFKENCPDVRNTKVVDIVHAIESYSIKVDVYDPWIDVNQAWNEYKLNCLVDLPQANEYSAVVLAVGHNQFLSMGIDGIKKMGIHDAVIYDVKGLFGLLDVDGRL